LNGKQGSATGKVQAEACAFLRAFTKVRRLEDSPIPKRTASTITHAQTVPAGRFVRCSSEFPSRPNHCPLMKRGEILGEVSTANDDLDDNFFVNPEVGRYPGIEEDEPPVLRLISEKRA
jgi:hypothetical protein